MLKFDTAVGEESNAGTPSQMATLQSVKHSAGLPTIETLQAFLLFRLDKGHTSQAKTCLCLLDYFWDTEHRVKLLLEAKDYRN